MRAEGYREKVEQQVMLESIKENKDKFGTRLWYMTLRNNDNNKRRKENHANKTGLIVCEDLPDAFNHS